MQRISRGMDENPPSLLSVQRQGNEGLEEPSRVLDTTDEHPSSMRSDQYASSAYFSRSEAVVACGSQSKKKWRQRKMAKMS